MNLGFICAIGAAVTWGLVYALDQKILATTSPLALLFFANMIAAVLVLPFILIDHNALKTLFSSGKSNLALILFTTILATVANFLIFYGIKNLGASAASIIEIAYPFFVILFSFLLFRSVPNFYFFLGGFLIFIGSVIIVRFA